MDDEEQRGAKVERLTPTGKTSYYNSTTRTLNLVRVDRPLKLAAGFSALLRVFVFQKGLKRVCISKCPMPCIFDVSFRGGHVYLFSVACPILCMSVRLSFMISCWCSPYYNFRQFVTSSRSPKRGGGGRRASM